MPSLRAASQPRDLLASTLSCWAFPRAQHHQQPRLPYLWATLFRQRPVRVGECLPVVKVSGRLHLLVFLSSADLKQAIPTRKAQSHYRIRSARCQLVSMRAVARKSESTSSTPASIITFRIHHSSPVEMASLPSLPTLDPIVLQFPFGYDATFEAHPPAPLGNHASEAKLTPANSLAPSLRKVSFVRHNTSSEMGGDAAIPEPEPVSVPEAVTSPASTEVPEGINPEVVHEQAVTTVPADVPADIPADVPADAPVVQETVVNEVPVEAQIVENIETIEAPPPSPGIQKSTTVVITVPADEAVEEPEVIQDEGPPLRRSSTTITVTVAAEPAVPSRRASLAAPRTAFVAPESTDAQFEAPRKTETIKLEGGTSVTVTEAAPPQEQPTYDLPKTETVPKTVKKVKITKTKVTRVRVMSLWRRIIAKILRKRAEKKIQQTAQVDGSRSPQGPSGNATHSLLRLPSVERSEPEAANDACERHTENSPRMGIDEYFLHDNAARSDVKSPANAEASREEPCAVVRQGS
ncbi:hypothetical protein IWX46DRAFT_582181 [Phyllosticta citricarpa]|uniref:Uncharacterized protein n=2 Tax=Phyllosticta TaxID=121621 RepID=A0ABR1M645_9PEZI